MQKGLIVSVAMIVYNHEKYLRRAIDSILMQDFEGELEVVIGEDCSTDASRSIIKEYEKKYPSIIKPIYNEQNLGMKKNGANVFKSVHGKYVALLEGDDYWVDPEKLKKQISFLENNLDYSGVTHNVIVVDEDEAVNEKNQNLYPFHKEGDYFLDEFLNGVWPGQTASFVFRNFYANMSDSDIDRVSNYQMNGDIRILLTMLLSGKVYCMKEKMSCYRYVDSHGDSWNAQAKTRNMSSYYYNTAREIDRFAKEEYGIIVEAKRMRYDAICNAILEACRRRKKDDFINLKCLLKQEKNKAALLVFVFEKVKLHVKRKI